MTIIQRKFTDLDFNFGCHPASNDVIRKYDDASIIQSVKSLVMSNFYDRPFQPAVGSGLIGLLFENDSLLTQYSIKTAILDVISNNEPRVEIDEEDVIVKWNPDLVSYTVEIYIHVVGLERTFNTTLTLNRIR